MGKMGENNLRFLNVIHPNFCLLLMQIFSLTPFAKFLTVRFKVVSYPFKNIPGFHREQVAINERLQFFLAVKNESF
jgi:hypothetical protein